MSRTLCIRIRNSNHNNYVTKDSIRNEDFASVQDPVTAVALGVCSNPLKVTERVNLFLKNDITSFYR